MIYTYTVLRPEYWSDWNIVNSLFGYNSFNSMMILGNLKIGHVRPPLGGSSKCLQKTKSH